MTKSDDSEENQNKNATEISSHDEIANQIQEWIKFANGVHLEKEISRELETHLRQMYSNPETGMNNIKASIESMRDNEPFAYLKERIKKISMTQHLFSEIAEISREFFIRFRKKIVIYLLFIMMLASYIALWAPIRVFFQKLKIHEIAELPIDQSVSKFFIFEIIIYAAIAPATFWLGYLVYTLNIAKEKNRKWRAIRILFKTNKSLYGKLFFLILALQIFLNFPNISESLFSSNTLGLILPANGTILFGFWIEKTIFTAGVSAYAYICFTCFNDLRNDIRKNIVNRRKLDRIKEKHTNHEKYETKTILPYVLLTIFSIITTSLVYLSIENADLKKLLINNSIENSTYSQVKRDLQQQFNKENIGNVHCQRIIDYSGKSIKIITSLVLKENENPFVDAEIKVKSLQNENLKTGKQMSCEQINTFQKINSMIREKAKQTDDR